MPRKSRFPLNGADKQKYGRTFVIRVASLLKIVLWITKDEEKNSHTQEYSYKDKKAICFSKIRYGGWNLNVSLFVTKQEKMFTKFGYQKAKSQKYIEERNI